MKRERISVPSKSLLGGMLLAVMFVLGSRQTNAQDLIGALEDAQLAAILTAVVPSHQLVEKGQFRIPYGPMNEVRVTVLNKKSSLLFAAVFKPNRSVTADQLNGLASSIRYVRLIANKDGSVAMVGDHLISGGVSEANLKVWLEMQLGQIKVVRELLDKD